MCHHNDSRTTTMQTTRWPPTPPLAANQHLNSFLVVRVKEGHPHPHTHHKIQRTLFPPTTILDMGQAFSATYDPSLPDVGGNEAPLTTMPSACHRALPIHVKHGHPWSWQLLPHLSAAWGLAWRCRLAATRRQRTNRACPYYHEFSSKDDNDTTSIS
jgi:hypothetical protein